MRCAVLALGLALATVCAGPGARAQELTDIRWGFAGKVVPGEFNILTVDVRNPSDQEFAGTLILEKSSGIGRLGARLIEPCFLAPRSQRRLQLFPFVVVENESWSLRWADSRLQRQSVPDARAGARAVVLLDSDEVFRDPVQDLHSFPAGSFPTTVGATDTLSDAILDHAPEWDNARREAFLGWLRRGGRLHLVRSGADYPEFTAQLAVLNEPSDRFRIGAGQVIRYPYSRRTLRVRALDLATSVPSKDQGFEGVAGATAPMILGTLKAEVQPDHSWGLIFLCAFAFLALVGPVHWRAARRGLDYRLSILALLLVVAGFTWLFREIGARGYGERTGVMTLGYARPLGDGAWDAVLYSNVFVTEGDIYRIGIGAERGMFSTAEQNEAVSATIDNGTGASMTVDIPLFSSRPLVRRATFAGPRFEIGAVDRATGDLSRLALSVEGELPFGRGDLLGAWAFTGDRIVELRWDKGDRLVSAGSATMFETFLNLQQLRVEGTYMVGAEYAPPARYASGGQSDEGGEPDLRQRARGLVKALLAERLHLLGKDDARSFFGREQLSVLLLAPSPASFALRGEGLGQEQGFVLYHVDVDGEK